VRFLITGSAGFIGFHLAKRLLADGHIVFGVDGFTPYYDVKLKERRQQILAQSNRFTAHKIMLEDFEQLAEIFLAAKPEVVVHLAAQAGVRYSLDHPRSYIDANIVGTFNVLEILRRLPISHLIIASSSAVYGANRRRPFTENERTDHPLSLYGATKKAGELMAHNYAHLWNIPTTMLRFFTVYGPWGRPDMALFKFVDAIRHDRPVDIYNEGRMSRDFTYIDDLVEAMLRLVPCIPSRDRANDSDPLDSLSPVAPFRVVNIGRGEPVDLLEFVRVIEQCLGKKAVLNPMAIQPGDVPDTFASADLLERLTGYRPATPVETGVPAFIAWYREYFKI
jgi:UDP-glucuronate 4-epimerase